MSNTRPSEGSATPIRDNKTATEYRLSISSNPGSRRSSLGASHDASDTENMVNTYLLPQIQELADAMITLDSNFTQMNFIHESLIDLNESVGALLYGLMCNSWCVDFSCMPHDTPAELKVMQELVRLAEEKQTVLNQLSDDGQTKRRQETTHQKSSIELSVPAKKQLNSSPIFTHSEFNDDDNTDASFISNPSMMPAPSTRKLRRKSILHTIRNNVTSNPDIFDQQKRRSLAVSASRLVHPNKRNTLGGTAARNTAESPTKKVRKQQTLKKRPPFR